MRWRATASREFCLVLFLRSPSFEPPHVLSLLSVAVCFHLAESRAAGMQKPLVTRTPHFNVGFVSTVCMPWLGRPVDNLILPAQRSIVQWTHQSSLGSLGS